MKAKWAAQPAPTNTKEAATIIWDRINWGKTHPHFDKAVQLVTESGRSPKPIPTVFAAKGYAESANAPDRVGRAEFDQLKSLVQREILARSAKDTRHWQHEAWGNAALEGAKVPPPKGFGDMTGVVFGGCTKAQWNQGPKVTPPAEACREPGVRVFRQGQHTRVVSKFGAIRADGAWGKEGSGAWYPMVASEWWTQQNCTELAPGPEKDAIVAEWRAWRGKQ